MNLFLDYKSGVEFLAYIPYPKDPMNSFPNGSKPVEGLDKAVGVGLFSSYSYKRSKQELRKTIHMLETE
jgi:hypothetical protein